MRKTTKCSAINQYNDAPSNGKAVCLSVQNHTGKLWKWSGNERRRGKDVDYHMDQRMWQRDRSREAGAGTGPGMDGPTHGCAETG